MMEIPARHSLVCFSSTLNLLGFCVDRTETAVKQKERVRMYYLLTTGLWTSPQHTI